MKKQWFYPADILLPKDNFEKWAVIACDQYTSDQSYWEQAAQLAAGAPSSLRIVYPEAYLSEEREKRISSINQTMREYCANGVFREIPDTFVYVERETSGGTRRGIVGLIDLQEYSFEKTSQALIRATEATVTERIPPRVEIRRDACLEIPHVMLLIDDPGKTVIEPLTARKDAFAPLYDFDLMMRGGHIRGFAVDKPGEAAITAALANLHEQCGGLLFAVGDGNHSLATAKECYSLHPTDRSRYALVEVVNVHDSSLHFEPIYRVLFGVDPDDVIRSFSEARGGEADGAEAQTFTCVAGTRERKIAVTPSHPLSIGTLQAFLDEYLAAHPSATLDYIHGENALRELAKGENTLGFLFSGMEKSELFEAVRQGGSLPRKTFSMGTADDKRFYMECRKL